MPGQNIIELGFDVPSFSKEQTDVYNGLLQIRNIAKEIDGLKFTPGTDNSWQQLNANQKGLTDNLEKLIKANIDYVNSLKSVADSNKKVAATSIDDIKAINDNTAAVQNNNKARSSKVKETPEQRQAYVESIPFTSNLPEIQAEQDALQKTGAVVNELDIAQAQAANSATVWGEAIAVTAAEQGTLQVATEGVTVSLKEKVAMEKAAAVAAKEDAAINAEISNDYKQLSLAYNDAALKAKNYSLQLGATHPLTIQAQSDANQLGGLLKKLDSGVGQEQRNVGGYFGAISKGFGLLRQAAYIIPGIGLAGIFNVLFEAIGSVVQKMDLFKTKITEVKLYQQEYSKALSDTNTTYVKAIENVDRLTIEVDAAKKGIVDKNEVVKDYNETMGKTTGQVQSLVDVEKKLIDDADAYIQVQLLKSAALIALSDAAKEAVDGQKNLQEQQDIAKDVNQKGDAQADKAAGADGVSDFLSRGVTNTANKAKQDSDDLINKLKNIAKKFYDEAAKISKNHHFNLFDDDGTDKTKLKKAFDTEGELYKIYLQKQIDAQNEIEKNEQNSLDRRKDALQKSFALRQELLKADLSVQLKLNSEAQSNTLTELKTAKPGSNAQKNLQTDLGNEQGQKLVLQAKYNAASIKLEAERIDAVKAFEEKATEEGEALLNSLLTADAARYKKDADNVNKSLDDRLEAQRKYVLAQQAIIDEAKKTALRKAGNNATLAAKAQSDASIATDNLTNSNVQDTSSIALSSLDKSTKGDENSAETKSAKQQYIAIQRLNGAYNKGRITVEKYNKELTKIQDAVKVDELAGKIKLLNAEIDAVTDNKSITTDDKKNKIKDLEGEVAKLRLQLQDAQQKQTVDSRKFKPLTGQDEIKLAQDTQDAIFSIIEDRYEKEKNLIQDQINLVESQKEANIAAVNGSTLNAQQKAAELQRIEITANAQKQKLLDQQKKANIEEAKFQKSAALLKIAENIAIAISSGNIAEAIAGGIQLAVVAAKPIPTYAHGTNYHPGGKGLVGEGRNGNGFVPEMIYEPGKDPFTVYKPTLLDMARGTKVVPMKGDSMNDYLMRKGMAHLAQESEPVDSNAMLAAMTNSMVNEVRGMHSTIKKQKAPNVTFVSQERWKAYIKNAT